MLNMLKLHLCVWKIPLQVSMETGHATEQWWVGEGFLHTATAILVIKLAMETVLKE